MLALLIITLRDSMGPSLRDRMQICPVDSSTFLVTPSSASIRLSDDALESVLVPLDGLGLVHAVGGSDLAPRAPALGNTLAGPGHADVEVHTVDTAKCQYVNPLHQSQYS